MKLILVFLLSLVGSSSWAQNNNNEKRETLIKVWGFLKYNHPLVATGIVDWDSVFVEKLARIDESRNDQEVDEIYLDWLTKLKPPRPCLTCGAITPVTYSGNAVLDWDAAVGLSSAVKEQLNYILQNRNIGKNYYVQFHQKTRLPLFNNERKINTQALPNEQQRLLALARYWNAIQFFYPYKHLTTVEWNAVLREMIPIFQSASSSLEYQFALLKMNKYLANSNAFVASELIFEKIGKKKVPFKMEYVQQQWKVVKTENDSLAAIGNLQLGDVVTHVNGVTTDQLAEEKKIWISSSNERSLGVSVGSTLLNGDEDRVALQIIRNGESLQLEQKRYPIIDYYWESDEEQSQLPWQIVDDKTVWLSAKDLEFDQLNAFQQVISGKRNLIVDLRDYNVPTAFKLADYLVTRARVFAQMIEPNLEYLGTFKTLGRKNEIPVVKQFFTGKTYVLINEKTRGQAEFLAVLFKGSDRITLVGSNTSGTVGYTTKLVLPGEVSVFFTGIGIQNVDGSDVQQKGIAPDLVLDLPVFLENKKEIVEEILLKTQNP